MANTIISELIRYKCTIQLDESTFSTNNILMAYVRFCSASMKCIIDEFVFAKYLRLDSKGETIYKTLQEYFEFHDIPLTNITAVTCDGVPAMIGRYRGFSAFLKETVPEIITVHCVTHRRHIVSKNLSSELHNYLQVCIRAINIMKSDRFVLGYLHDCKENSDTFKHLFFSYRS